MQVVVNVLATAWFLNCRNVSIVGMPKTDTDSNQHQTHSQIHLKLYKLLVGLCWNEYIFCMAIMALLHSDYRNIFNILLVWFVGYGWNEVTRDVSLKRLQHDRETFDSTGGRVMKYKLSCVLNKCHSFIIFLLGRLFVYVPIAWFECFKLLVLLSLFVPYLLLWNFVNTQMFFL